MIHDSVRTLVVTLPEPAEHQERKYGSFDKKIISRFPNLLLLEISDELPVFTSLRIQEQSTISGLTLIITRFDGPECIAYFGPSRPKIAGATSTVITSIMILQENNGPDGDGQFTDYLVNSFMRWVRGDLQKPVQDSLQASAVALLQVFVYEHDEALKPDDLADFLLLCPHLTTLSTRISPYYSSEKLEAILSSGLSKLMDVSIIGANLRWLVNLERCHSVSLVVNYLPADEWLRNANVARLAKEAILPQHHGTGSLRLVLRDADEPDSPSSSKLIRLASPKSA